MLAPWEDHGLQTLSGLDWERGESCLLELSRSGVLLKYVLRQALVFHADSVCSCRGHIWWTPAPV